MTAIPRFSPPVEHAALRLFEHAGETGDLITEDTARQVLAELGNTASSPARCANSP